MDAYRAKTTKTEDRGIPPPKSPRSSGQELPLVGFRIHGPGIVDCDAINAVAGGNLPVESSAELPNPSAAQPLRKLSVLMPIHNERGTLPAIVRRVLASPVELQIELVAVDDG